MSDELYPVISAIAAYEKLTIAACKKAQKDPLNPEVLDVLERIAELYTEHVRLYLQVQQRFQEIDDQDEDEAIAHDLAQAFCEKFFDGLSQKAKAELNNARANLVLNREQKEMNITVAEGKLGAVKQHYEEMEKLLHQLTPNYRLNLLVQSEG